MPYKKALCFNLLLFWAIRSTAQSVDDQCSEPMDPGAGEEKEYRFYFEKGFCLPFFYKGQGGNANRFKTDSACMEACAPSQHGERYPPGEAVCSLQVDYGSCFALKPMYHFSVEEGTCRLFHYGGCQGNGNRFETREECESTCRAKGGRTLGGAPGLNPDERTADAGLIVGILGSCLFAVAVIAVIVFLVVQRKGRSQGRTKVLTSDIEMSREETS